MKKFIFHVALVLLGTGSAFATKMVKESNKAIVDGYRLVDHGNNEYECVNAQQSCSTIADGPACKWTLDNDVKLQGAGSETTCGDPLFEIIP